MPTIKWLNSGEKLLPNTVFIDDIGYIANVKALAIEFLVSGSLADQLNGIVNGLRPIRLENPKFHFFPANLLK